MTPSIGAMIDRFKELEAFEEAEQADFDQRMKPYRDSMKLLNAQILAELQRSKQQNAKSEEGNCAYQQKHTSVKVINRVDFLQFALDNERRDMLDVRALKEPVKEYLEANNGTPPPGVTVEFTTVCNIRKG